MLLNRFSGNYSVTIKENISIIMIDILIIYPTFCSQSIVFTMTLRTAIINKIEIFLVTAS